MHAALILIGRAIALANRAGVWRISYPLPTRAISPTLLQACRGIETSAHAPVGLREDPRQADRRARHVARRIGE